MDYGITFPTDYLEANIRHRARYLIWELVNQLNAEGTQNDRRPMAQTPA